MGHIPQYDQPLRGGTRHLISPGRLGADGTPAAEPRSQRAPVPPCVSGPDTSPGAIAHYHLPGRPYRAKPHTIGAALLQ